MVTMMWEARAESETMDGLLAWVRGIAVPEISDAPAWQGAEIYRSDDHRVVVIAHFDGPVRDLPEPPTDLVARPPHAWTFTRVE
ncbi:MAG TPA: hypothetical protein H9881_01895 [Candidatus Stackebrandtia excrementipullorum]|nr:hypothetical protein [Candidatus Stackebrandtia excrementipullorum]